MNNQMRIEMALLLLREVSRSWNDNEVISYPESLPSFDDLIADLSRVKLAN